MSNFIPARISSIPRDLAPAVQWLRWLVISRTQHQTKTTFTTWTQLYQFFTSSRQRRQRQTETTFTTWTQLYQLFTSSIQWTPSPPEHICQLVCINSLYTSSLPAQDNDVNIRPRPPSPPQHNCTSSLLAQDNDVNNTPRPSETSILSAFGRCFCV